MIRAESGQAQQRGKLGLLTLALRPNPALGQGGAAELGRGKAWPMRARPAVNDAGDVRPHLAPARAEGPAVKLSAGELR